MKIIPKKQFRTNFIVLLNKLKFFGNLTCFLNNNLSKYLTLPGMIDNQEISCNFVE